MAKKKTDDKLKKNVLKKIKNGDVKMHSSTYFILLSAATIASIVLLTILAAVLSRMLFDDINTGFRSDLHHLGGRGRHALVASFPLELLLLTITTVAGTVYLFRKRDISYKHDLKLFYVSVIGSVLVLGVLVGTLNINFRQAPFLKELSSFGELADEQIARGRLVEVIDQSMIIVSREGDEIIINYESAEVIGKPSIGEPVVAIGSWTNDGSFKAEAIRFADMSRFMQNMKEF